MKLILALAVSLNFAFASTYDFFMPEPSISTQDSTYQLESTMSIDIDMVFDTQMDVLVNGEMKTLPVRALKRERDGAFMVTSYKATLKTDVLADMICDEREAVSYELTFKKKVSRAGSSITDVALSATYEYTYDWCHSTPEYTTYEYLLK